MLTTSFLLHLYYIVLNRLINKTVSQVIAAYLWSTDLNTLGGIGHEDDLTSQSSFFNMSKLTIIFYR